MKSQKLFAFATFFAVAGATPLAERLAGANHTRSLGKRAPGSNEELREQVSSIATLLAPVDNNDVGSNIGSFMNIGSETFFRIVRVSDGSTAP